jgi:hypothetical protein
MGGVAAHRCGPSSAKGNGVRYHTCGLGGPQRDVVIYEIREVDAIGDLIKTVEADNAFRAIELAFPGKEFHRETGWGGGSGTWKVRGVRLHVWVGPAAVTPAKPKLKTKPKAKAK